MPLRQDFHYSFLAQTVAIVDRTSQVDEAAAVIARARFSRMGSSPYAPDIVLVNEFVLDKFTAGLLQHLPSSMTKEDNSPSPSTSGKHRRLQSKEGHTTFLNHAERLDGVEVLARGTGGSILNVRVR